MQSYKSVQKSMGDDVRPLINWDRMFNICPKMFLLTFFSLLGGLLLWAQLSFSLFTYFRDNF